MQKKSLFFLVLLVILSAGCTAGPDSPPSVYLLVNGEKIPGYIGAYCWDGGLSGTLCVDPMPPSFEGQSPIELGGKVELALDRPLPESLNVSLSPELFGDAVAEADLDAKDEVDWTPATVPPGEYVLNVNVGWDQGDVTYWFYVSLP